MKAKIKRFAIFGGPCYYPGGGMNDYLESHERKKQAIERAREIKKAGRLPGTSDHREIDWIHVWDMKRNESIEVKNGRP